MPLAIVAPPLVLIHKSSSGPSDAELISDYQGQQMGDESLTQFHSHIRITLLLKTANRWVGSHIQSIHNISSDHLFTKGMSQFAEPQSQVRCQVQVRCHLESSHLGLEFGSHVGQSLCASEWSFLGGLHVGRFLVSCRACLNIHCVLVLHFIYIYIYYMCVIYILCVCHIYLCIYIYVTWLLIFELLEC